MMSLETIRSMDAEASAKAARTHRRPLVLFSADTIADDVRRAPVLGVDYVHPAWRRATPADLGISNADHGVYGKGDADDGLRLFVDTSGFGSRGEPALTFAELVEVLTKAHAHAAARKLALGVGLSMVGQFQGHLELYVQERTLRNVRGKGRVAA